MKRTDVLYEIEVLTRVVEVNKGVFGREGLATKANDRIEKLLERLDGPFYTSNMP